MGNPIISIGTSNTITGGTAYASDAAYEAAKGSAGANGDFYYNTTEAAFRFYQGAWHFLRGGAIVPYASSAAYVTGKGSSAANGDFFYNSTSHSLNAYLNGAWVSVGSNQGSPNELFNASLSVADDSAGSLTIFLKTSAGNNPSASDPVYIGFRNLTATTGTYTRLAITSTVSLVLGNGSSLGLTGATSEYIYVYLMNDNGTPTLAVMGGANLIDEGSLTTATTGAGGSGADTRYTLYSTGAVSSRPIRMLGRLLVTEAVAGVHDTDDVDEIALLPFRVTAFRNEVLVYDGHATAHGTTDTKVRRFNAVGLNVGTAITVNGSGAGTDANGHTFTINEEGVYAIHYIDEASGGAAQMGISVNSAQLTTDINAITTANRLAYTSTSAAGFWGMVSITTRLKPGDVVRAHTGGTVNSTSDIVRFNITKIAA